MRWEVRQRWGKGREYNVTPPTVLMAGNIQEKAFPSSSGDKTFKADTFDGCEREVSGIFTWDLHLTTYLINDVLYEPRHHWDICWLEEEHEHKTQGGEGEDSGGQRLPQDLPHGCHSNTAPLPSPHVPPGWGAVWDWRFQLRTESQRQWTGLETRERERAQ